MSTTRRILGLAGWVLLSVAAGAVGGLASANAPSFYAELSRPTWAPPAGLFGPVWSILYLSMGVAAWLVWRERGFRAAGPALGLFLVQLAGNALWTWVFFAWRHGRFAFIEIVILWALILATIVAFWRVRRLAGILMIPYLAWVAYAAALTYALWQRNPGLLA